MNLKALLVATFALLSQVAVASWGDSSTISSSEIEAAILGDAQFARNVIARWRNEEDRTACEQPSRSEFEAFVTKHKGLCRTVAQRVHALRKQHLGKKGHPVNVLVKNTCK